MRLALGSDIGAGTGPSLLKEALMTYLMQPLADRPSPAQLLHLATRAGALALGLGDECGDLQPGRSADFILLRPGATLATVLESAPDWDARSARCSRSAARTAWPRCAWPVSRCTSGHLEDGLDATARSRTSTSPACGASRSTGWIEYGAPFDAVTAARISVRAKLPGMPRALALTFDNLGEAAERARGGEPARPHPSVTTVLPWLLALLAKLRLSATFCVEGVNTQDHPDAVRAIAAAGHEIALHGWAREPFDPDALARARAAFAALGIHPVGYRPPGGALPPDGLRTLAGLGVRWCSPEGDRAHVDDATGVAVVRRWPLVDATYLHVPFADLRAGLGLPASRSPPRTPRPVCGPSWRTTPRRSRSCTRSWPPTRRSAPRTPACSATSRPSRPGTLALKAPSDASWRTSIQALTRGRSRYGNDSPT